ncbi:hypothetical protein CXB51_024186 [Gossypium anomalum]|uniref:ATP-dependent RNA helicase n=1 Tax=Gossypium anomalum TaxID=47600 RepID=A0A8J5YPV0_9ROSI|nr:hypothetical protein CXB51_024186 [Gossypium anomalum]
MAAATTSRAAQGMGAKDEKLVFETTEGIEPIFSFDQMGLKDDLLRGTYNYGFEKSSTIQQRAVVPIINGRDVIAQARSGIGKTSMIALTVCQVVDTASREVQALILSPTRKLASQTEKVIRTIGDFTNIQAHACIEGKSVGKDIRKLENRVHVVSGTPGRVDLEEAKTQENAKLQCALQDIQLQFKETKELLAKEREAAKKAAEVVPIIQEVSVVDPVMLEKLTNENEKLKALVSSLEKKIDETEKKFEETNKISEERIKNSLVEDCYAQHVTAEGTALVQQVEDAVSNYVNFVVVLLHPIL